MRTLLALIRRWLFGSPEPPLHPPVGVRVPVRRGPAGRHGAVALEEPDGDSREAFR